LRIPLGVSFGGRPRLQVSQSEASPTSPGSKAECNGVACSSLLRDFYGSTPPNASYPVSVCEISPSTQSQAAMPVRKGWRKSSLSSFCRTAIDPHPEAGLMSSWIPHSKESLASLGTTDFAAAPAPTEIFLQKNPTHGEEPEKKENAHNDYKVPLTVTGPQVISTGTRNTSDRDPPPEFGPVGPCFSWKWKKNLRRLSVVCGTPVKGRWSKMEPILTILLEITKLYACMVGTR